MTWNDVPRDVRDTLRTLRRDAGPVPTALTGREAPGRAETTPRSGTPPTRLAELTLRLPNTILPRRDKRVAQEARP